MPPSAGCHTLTLTADIDMKTPWRYLDLRLLHELLSKLDERLSKITFYWWKNSNLNLRGKIFGPERGFVAWKDRLWKDRPTVEEKNLNSMGKIFCPKQGFDFSVFTKQWLMIIFLTHI